MPSCLAIGTYKLESDSRKSFTVQVPAHVYNFDLADFDGYSLVDGDIIKQRFEYMFPPTTQELNVTVKNENVHFTFHPIIVLNMKISEGLYAQENFADASCLKDAEIKDPPLNLISKVTATLHCDLNFGRFIAILFTAIYFQTSSH